MRARHIAAQAGWAVLTLFCIAVIIVFVIAAWAIAHIYGAP